MTHQMHLFDGEDYFGDLYVNEDGLSYTVIMNDPNPKQLRDWWTENLYGGFDIVDEDSREGKTCYLLHTNSGPIAT